MNNLQLFSFEINEYNIIDNTIYSMKFPKELKQLIERLKVLKAKNFGYSFALKGLAKIVKNYSRDIVSVSSNHNDLLLKDKLWICSISKFNLKGLKLHICQWINTELKNASKLTEDFYIDEELKWEYEINTKDMFNENYNLYDIIPNLYARDLCKVPLYFNSINKAFRFYPLMLENGVALITEPIVREWGEPISYNISIALKKPYDGSGKLYLNLNLGTKLWQNAPIINDDEDKNYATKEGTSIYIFKKDEFVKEQDISFIQCSFIRNSKNVRWKNSYDVGYADNINLDINKIVRNPGEYIDFNKELICLITNKRKDSFTKRGAGMPERIEVFKLFQKMYPELKARQEINAIKYKGIGKTITAEKFDKDLEELKKIKIKKWIKMPLKYSNENRVKRIIISIYSDNEKLYLHTKNITKMMLGLKEGENLISPQEIEVKFENIKGNIMRALEVEENKLARVKEIENEVACDKIDTDKYIALVDIPKFHKSKNENIRKLDSKSVVRVALKNKGIQSQFINGFDEVKGYHKLINALQDLLFAAGFLNDEYYKLGFENKVLLGLDFVPGYSSKYLAMSKIDKGRIFYKIYNEDNWIEASEFTCRLSDIKLKKSSDILFKEKAEGVNDWVCNTIQQEIDSSENEIYLFADASLRYNYWRIMSNDNLKFDNLDIVDNGDKLKIIRINNTNENPDYYIGDGSHNLKKGLFSNDYETYYMVGGKSDTFQIGKTWTKYDNLSTQLVKQKVTEMVILGGESEEKREEIAKDCYALRKLIPTYEKEVLLPLPMYVIKRIGEYIGAMEDIR